MLYCKKIVTLIFLGISIKIPITEAKWASFDDASKEVKFYNQKIKINGDGTYEAIIETKEKILTEEGRSEAVNYRLYYDANNTKIDILEAKTIYNNEEYKVNKGMIENKALATNRNGFENKKQILISFPKAEIGAEIYLKYKEKGVVAVLPNFYSGRFYYGLGGYWQSSNVTITSILPLHIKINDPEKVLEIKKDKEDNFNKIEINLLEPVYKETINEPYNGVMDEKHLTWVSISSLDNWEDLARKIASSYEQVINQKLPRAFEIILEKANQTKAEIEKINIVTSMINEKVQYMGDWRLEKSRFAPKDLDKIAKSQIGDCKDFVASTAAILKELGFKVQIAAVMRGIYEPLSKEGLPDPDNFNHVLIKVISSKTNQIYWIDPTNPVSMAQGIFDDIAGKEILVLDSKNPSHEKIPNVNYKQSETIILDQLEIVNDKVIHSGSFTLKGQKAARLIENRLYRSDEFIKNEVYYFISGVNLEEQDKKELTLPKTTRIVEDITLNFKYDQNNQIIKTNLLPGIKIDSSWMDAVISSVPEQISDLRINSPSTITEINIIKGKKIKFIGTLNYEIDTSWLRAERRGRVLGDSTEIKDTIIFKKPFITSEELKTLEYKNLKKELIQNFKNFIIILSDE